MKNARIPLFLQDDPRWGQQPYGNTVMAMCGCGPTSLSMVVCGLTQDGPWDPPAVARYAMEHSYYISGFGSAFELMTIGAEEMGLQVEKGIVSTTYIHGNLSADTPMICLVGSGDFIDGDTHFIVLAGSDRDGKVLVNDPSSVENSQKAWDAAVLTSQMLEVWRYTAKNRA